MVAVVCYNAVKEKVMSKGILNSLILKKLFEDVDGKELLPILVKSKIISNFFLIFLL